MVSRYRILGFPAIAGFEQPHNIEHKKITMPNERTSELPTWAPRVSRAQIERLYRCSGKGILDDELIADVGFALYARCESILKVKDAMRGQLLCPRCDTRIQRTCHVSDDEEMRCAQCGWQRTWQDYRSTFEGKLLNAGDMERFCREYLNVFRATRAAGEKLVLIDTLIHRLHGELVGGNKPGAYAFIEGDIDDVASFLDRLTYGEQMPEDIKKTRDAWRKRVRSGSPFWTQQLEDSMTDEEDALA